MAEKINPASKHRAIIVPAAAIAAAHLSINAEPLLLGSLVDGLDLDVADAGLLATLELVAFGCASLATAPAVNLIRARKAAILALLVTALANILSMLVINFELLAALRIASGAGGGALAAVAYALVSRQPDSEKQFAKCYVALFFSAMLGYLLIPFFSDPFLHRGVFGFVAAGSILTMPVMLMLDDEDGRPGATSQRSPLLSPNVILLIGGAMLLTFSDGLVWPMTERIGSGLGLGSGTIGIILALGVITGMPGLLAAGRLGSRAGTLGPILLGMWGTAIAGLIIALAGGTPMFVIGILLKNPFFFLALPYIMAAASRLDPRGHASALLGGMLPLGAGLGPWPAGAIADQFGFPMVGWAGLGSVLVATFLFCLALWKTRHRMAH